MRRLVLGLVVVVAAGCAEHEPATETVALPLWKVKPRLTTGDSDDTFGYATSISADGTRLLIGAPNGLGAGGQAYVYVQTGATWTFEQQLATPSGARAFGSAVSLTGDGSRAIVGARETSTATGTAYVFVRTGTTWAFEAELLQGDGNTGDEFGGSVSISGDGTRAVIGARNDATTVSTQGGAYVFSRTGSTWSLEQKLFNPEAVPYEGFGSAVSLDGTGATLVVGAIGGNVAALGEGTAYVLTRSSTTWTITQEIPASDGQENDRYGWAVAVSADGTRAIVGASDDMVTESHQGSAYVWRHDGAAWVQEQHLVAPVAASLDRMGISVALDADGSIAVIGADYGGALSAGAAHVFERTDTTWTHVRELMVDGGAYGDALGWSVTIDGTGAQIAAGVPYDDVVAADDNQGSAYVFGPPTAPTASFTAMPNPAACAQTVALDGSGSSDADGTIATYAWDFDDTGTGSGATVEHAYGAYGTYTVSLTVTDDDGLSGSSSIEVDVSQDLPPVAQHGGPYDVDLGSAISLDGSASSDPDVACGDSIMSYVWSVGSHAETGANAELDAAELTALGAGVHAVSLTVTDEAGLSDEASTTLTIRGPDAPPPDAGVPDAEPVAVDAEVQAEIDADPGLDAAPAPDDPGPTGCCSTGADPRGGLLILGVLVLVLRRRVGSPDVGRHPHAR